MQEHEDIQEEIAQLKLEVEILSKQLAELKQVLQIIFQRPEFNDYRFRLSSDSLINFDFLRRSLNV